MKAQFETMPQVMRAIADMYEIAHKEDIKPEWMYGNDQEARHDYPDFYHLAPAAPAHFRIPIAVVAKRWVYPLSVLYLPDGKTFEVGKVINIQGIDYALEVGYPTGGISMPPSDLSWNPPQPEQEFNTGHYLEAMDRCHTIQVLLDQLLDGHPAIKKVLSCQASIEQAQSVIGDVYQRLGRAEFDEEQPKGDTIHWIKNTGVKPEERDGYKIHIKLSDGRKQYDGGEYSEYGWSLDCIVVITNYAYVKEVEL